jgi:hypothetical protein
VDKPAYLAPIGKGPIDEGDPLSAARVLGDRDGRIWGRDPRAALEKDGCAVAMVTPGRMAEMRGLRFGVDRCAGFYWLADWPEKPTVYVDVTLSAREQRVTLAHELAHMRHSTWNEDDCEAYGRAFCG